MSTVTPVKQNHSLFEKHRSMIERAIESVHKREYYAQYPEMPSPQVYGETAEADQKKLFESQHGANFERLKQSHDTWVTSDEKSPYSNKALSVSYPAFKDSKQYIECTKAAASAWKKADVETRAGILFESLERMKTAFHEIAFSTMHTTGQAYLMSFQASGPHAADRALEAIALGYQELTRFPKRSNGISQLAKSHSSLRNFLPLYPEVLLSQLAALLFLSGIHCLVFMPV